MVKVSVINVAGCGYLREGSPRCNVDYNLMLFGELHGVNHNVALAAFMR